MEYQKIILPRKLQESRRVARVVFKANNYLNDIHTMLVLPKITRAKGHWGECQFAITTLLCCLIDGISKRLFPIDATQGTKKGEFDRERFRNLIVSDMPWAKKGAKWNNQSDAALKLYKYFRNDLIHGIALNDEGIIGNTGNLPKRDYFGIDELKIWPIEHQFIELDPVDDDGNQRVGKIKVVNVGLYWHTKRMIERVIAKRDMEKAEELMEKDKITPLKNGL